MTATAGAAAGPIARVGVVGGGLMGSGIAQVSAQAGLTTIVRELNDALCARAGAAITKSLDKAIEKGKLTPDGRTITLSCLEFTTNLPGTGRRGAKIRQACVPSSLPPSSS